MHPPITVAVNKDRTVARIAFPLAGNGTDAAAVRALKTLRDGIIPPVLKTLPPGHRGRRDRHDRGDVRLQPDHAAPRADRLRLRARAGVPAPAAHLPLDRHSAQGDRAQSPLGRGRVRRARLDLPGGSSRARAQLPLERRDRHLAAALPVHGALRPVDGLPRLHPQSSEGARRPRDADRRRPSSGASARRRPP